MAVGCRSERPQTFASIARQANADVGKGYLAVDCRDRKRGRGAIFGQRIEIERDVANAHERLDTQAIADRHPVADVGEQLHIVAVDLAGRCLADRAESGLATSLCIDPTELHPGTHRETARAGIAEPADGEGYLAVAELAAAAILVEDPEPGGS